MEWKILEFETKRGERPVAEFIKKQQSQAIAKIAHLIDLLEIHGSLLSMPHAKKLDINLYELRIRGKDEIRIVYGFKGKLIYLLHGFKKQKNKTPKKELDIARQRYWLLT
ncbi:hypothetical protein AUK04_00920 [Candidatus Roizmanbacteria bacterium CG2_30_33_16]|uniref:Type II toxin-antitoxin system RelE/ParE family toxin n=2 Tax=Candidatus Roizmaniibacteriota TaxID=1752723 RepID=A0A2M8DB70_9BACT|nr:type II toxin-antitoxin system RelE/ParE family toxin [Candidatus Roizmanbacteria bacterium]OIP85884.1 MAG: hypothetical protein AUK04_00920 [Candidatus Roizmanbacteria bacterium CG2_30_33_16]PJB87629.1 MAG: type II toxin-antitoxin system RelE/ParE family toxin [Candidatus Roizmanbacteria bacterium CG_4_9_14_0_8_um_filter_34_12]